RGSAQRMSVTSGGSWYACGGGGAARANAGDARTSKGKARKAARMLRVPVGQKVRDSGSATLAVDERQIKSSGTQAKRERPHRRRSGTRQTARSRISRCSERRPSRRRSRL